MNAWLTEQMVTGQSDTDEGHKGGSETKRM